MTDKKIDELHEMATHLNELAANSISHQVSLRMAAMTSGGYDFADTLRNIFMDYGYPAGLEFSNYWNMYRRFGIAKNIIELPVNTGWVTPPIIKSSDRFVGEIDRLNKRLKLWHRVKGLDTRQRVGRYAGMFMRVRDGLTPDKPLIGSLSGDGALMEMMPLYESQLEVIDTDDDPTSETYGQPIMMQYNQSANGDRNEDTNNTISIHASRIVFAAEGADDGWIYGIPALEAVYNSLMDLRKIIGGGGEGFYKNAAQNVVFDLKDPASALAYKEKLEDFNEQYDDFSRNRMRRSMWTPGMNASVLNSSMVGSKEYFDAALADVAAGCTPPIPSTMLVGHQTGERASTEDSKTYLSNVQSRRENFQTEMVRSIIDWCIKYAILPSDDYDVEWDDLLARSDSEKLDSASKMASINKDQFNSGNGAVFTENEIREAGGYEVEEELDIDGEELTGDDIPA